MWIVCEKLPIENTLNEYAQYVARVRLYAADMSLDQAVERAVDECIREGILAEFLTCNRNEVISMSIFEYDKELEEKKLRKAEYEAGFSEGEKHGIELNSIETARRMLQLQEFSLEKIAGICGLFVKNYLLKIFATHSTMQLLYD
jgi:hypothetical protein